MLTRVPVELLETLAVAEGSNVSASIATIGSAIVVQTFPAQDLTLTSNHYPHKMKISRIHIIQTYIYTTKVV